MSHLREQYCGVILMNGGLDFRQVSSELSRLFKVLLFF